MSDLGLGGTAGTDVTAVNSTLQGIARQLGLWVQAFSGRMVFGSFTCGGTATTTVTQPGIAANSFVGWIPTNATAGTLEGSAKKLYLATLTPGASFAVVTANAGTTAGTETFSYVVINPS